MRVHRKRNRWSQGELAKLMGWSTHERVSEAESARHRRFSPDEVERLATLLGVTATELMTVCAECGQEVKEPEIVCCGTCGQEVNRAQSM